MDVDYAPSAATLERIEQFRAGDLPVVSAYLPVAPGPEGRKLLRSETDSLLHEIRPLANDRSTQHDRRLSLRQDIERIGTLPDEQRRLKAGTVAIFSCSGAGFLEAIGLPRAVRTRITVDATAATRPMFAVLEEYQRCCTAVVDRETAYAWELYLGEVRDTDALPGAKLRGAGHAVNERRNHHKVEELEKRHFRQVASALDELFREGGYDVLALGGHVEELPRFMQQLSTAVRERVIGTFPVDHSVTPAAARERGEEIVRRYERDEHRRRLEEVLSTAAAGGPAAVGLASCLWAGSVRAVQVLFLQEGARSPGVVCDESRWLALGGERCPVCGRATRATPDVVDELVETVIDEGGSIHDVPAGSGLDERLAAASLRFPLPPAPDLASRGDLSRLA